MTTSEDEFGFDDLVLDDQTLAILDATERSLATPHSSTSHSTSSLERQHTKRLKTDGGWVPLYGKQPAEKSFPSKSLIKSRFSLEDTDLPEITINNGFYSGPGRLFVGSQQSDRLASPNALQDDHASAIDVTRPPLPQPSLISSPRPGAIGLLPERISQTRALRQRTPIDHTVFPTGDWPGFGDELESLRSQVEELKRQSAEQQRLLDQAMSEKRSKIGEVEILRATLHKNNTTHKEETDKLREAKEILEAAQVAAQKLQEAELERLHTQLKFKQHEIEASRRAVFQPLVPSQLAGSSQIQRSVIPKFPGYPVTTPQSPSQQLAVPPSRVPKARPLPAGFVNTFIGPHRRKKEGKVHASTSEQSRETGRETCEQGLDPLLPSPSSPMRASIYTQPDEDMEIDNDQVGGQATHGNNPEVDFDMHLAGEATMSQPIASFSKSAKPFDWVSWMRQLLLAHATSPQAPSTIQLLLAQPPLAADHDGAFHSACASLIGVAVGSAAYQAATRIVASSLAQIVSMLLPEARLKPLSCTLNLLAHLVICLPSFVIHLLKPADSPPFLQTICDMIVNILRPSNTSRNAPEFLDLGREVFFVLDAVIYALPMDHHPQLAVVPQTADVLQTLLSKDQPSSLLEYSTRALSYLSTRAGIYRSLLSFPLDTPENARDIAKLPQVDGMCALLMDSSRAGATGHGIRASVLIALTSLAIAHEDALMILSGSPFFIPSLVKLLADLTTALWEEDPELIASATLLSETVAGITKSMLLLHYVIFRTPTGPAGLRARLQAAPPRHFNGIGHQFVVALGRLSFAELPDEVSASDRMLLEQLADTARDVMDLVVAGPESESVWSLFQEEERGDEERGVDEQGEDGSPGSEEEIMMQDDVGALQHNPPPPDLLDPLS